ncbi:hypothetical protein VTL71DRAFT_14700 [Oculimacula yallundae]|uniref:Uncharacterized protein n=1 Tax=Oculimacula yallundae TaxID=86028 RepID=A0ABR4CJ75_9HELO
MAVTTSILPVDLEPSSSRSPLRQRSITPTPQNTIRRKNSFIRLADSSEDLPSSHESIFEAFCFSSSEASSHKAEIIDIPSRIPRPVKKNDENSREVSPFNFLDSIQFRYGHGTALDTITEQKSFATLSSKARTKSADNSPSIPFLGHRDSFIIAKTPRRQISFSLDDIAEIKRSYHDACGEIEVSYFALSDEICRPLLSQEVYAEPKLPIQAPPDRPPTPPGMPSWTESQTLTIPRRGSSRPPQAPRQSMVHRFFNISNTTTAPGGQASGDRNRVVSAPVPGRAAPRFRPPKSVYGPIDQHPFTKALIAQIDNDTPSVPRPRRRLQKDQRVRFTPSATARDSEANMLQAAIESTTTTAAHPFEPFSTTTISSSRKNCSHRKPNGSKGSVEGPRDTTVVEHSSLRSPLPYHGGEEINPWSPISPYSRTSSPSTPSHAELDSLCVTDSVRDRPPSACSTVHLMSGALRPLSPSLPIPQQREFPDLTKEKWCWKCTVQTAFSKLEDLWMSSAGFVCFVCCGFDIDEEGNVLGGKATGRRSRTTSGSGGVEMTRPRMVILNQTPAGIL